MTQKFSSAGGDAWSVGIVFTYQASTGRYYNAAYGYFDQLTYTASSNTNDNVSLSVFITNNYNLATTYAASPYTLEQNPSNFSYIGSVSVVTQPSYAALAPTQATPDSICAAAELFVGKSWNIDGCWVLASNISVRQAPRCQPPAPWSGSLAWPTANGSSPTTGRSAPMPTGSSASQPVRWSPS